MKRFLNESEVMKMSFPNEFIDEFYDIFSFQEPSVGSLGCGASLSGSTVVESSGISLTHSYVRGALNSSEIDELK